MVYGQKWLCVDIFYVCACVFLWIEGDISPNSVVALNPPVALCITVTQRSDKDSSLRKFSMTFGLRCHLVLGQMLLCGLTCYACFQQYSVIEMCCISWLGVLMVADCMFTSSDNLNVWDFVMHFHQQYWLWFLPMLHQLVSKYVNYHCSLALVQHKVCRSIALYIDSNWPSFIIPPCVEGWCGIWHLIHLMSIMQSGISSFLTVF